MYRFPADGNSRQRPRYLIISPVKDEVCYIERTLASVAKQSLQPVQWVIADDASSDRTPEIIALYAMKHDFIRIVRQSQDAGWQPGSGVVRAFNAGYQAARRLDYDFVVKLDCDLSFEPDYFERLLARFDEDDRLVIASGVFFGPKSEDEWVEIRMPDYYGARASKVVRIRCFEEIGGLVAAMR